MKVTEITPSNLTEELNERFGFCAYLGGEKFYNGKFEPSVSVREVAEWIVFNFKLKPNCTLKI